MVALGWSSWNCKVLELVPMIEHEVTGQALGLCPPSKHPTALVRVMNFSRAACGSQWGRQREGYSMRKAAHKCVACACLRYKVVLEDRNHYWSNSGWMLAGDLGVTLLWMQTQWRQQNSGTQSGTRNVRKDRFWMPTCLLVGCQNRSHFYF